MNNILSKAGIVLISLGASAQQIQHFTLKDLPAKPVNALLTRGTISEKAGTIGYFTNK